MEIPPALANDITAIESSVRFVMDGPEFEDAALPSIVSAFGGLTQQQIEDCTVLALRKAKTLNGYAARLTLHEKAGILGRNGLLKYLDPLDGGLSLIGGNYSVKRQIQRDKACLSSEARSLARTTPVIPRSWTPEPLRPALNACVTTLPRARQESSGFPAADVLCDSSPREVIQRAFLRRRSLMAHAAERHESVKRHDPDAGKEARKRVRDRVGGQLAGTRPAPRGRMQASLRS